MPKTIEIKLSEIGQEYEPADGVFVGVLPRNISKPYTMETLPDAVKALPKHGQEIWLATFNDTSERYDDEERVFAIAWGAVRRCQNMGRRFGLRLSTIPVNAMMMRSVCSPSLGVPFAGTMRKWTGGGG
jgi:cation transport regulator ChaB